MSAPLNVKEDTMSTAAVYTAIGSSHISEVLEVAHTILSRHRDEHLAKKTLIMEGFLEMRQRYPERDYRLSIDKALAELTDAVHIHLNAELHAAAALFGKLGKAGNIKDGQIHSLPQP
jgi:hypothetical protein